MSDSPECLVTGVGPGTGSAIVKGFLEGGYQCALPREMFPDKPDEFFCQPADIAQECFHLAHQRPSAWSSEMTIRPYVENW